MISDLHCHTKLSDGSLGIEEIISLALRKGINNLAITDHDTMAGATRALIIGKRKGINIIHGVELSAYDYNRKKNIHILCYNCKYPNRLEGLCHKTSESRKKASLEMAKKVMRLYPVAPEVIQRCATGSTNMFPIHIMQALYECGYADSMYGEVSKKLFDEDNGLCYIQPEFPSVEEVITSIHEAGGVAVLAHPENYGNLDIIEEIAPMVDGLEAYSPYTKPEEKQLLEGLAKRYNIVTTGGSNFHGLFSKAPNPLGSVMVPEFAVKNLLKKSSEIHKKLS